MAMPDDAPSRAELVALLRAHQPELQAVGVEAITVFGSFARGDAASEADVDLAIRAGAGFRACLLSVQRSASRTSWKTFGSSSLTCWAWIARRLMRTVGPVMPWGAASSGSARLPRNSAKRLTN